MIYIMYPWYAVIAYLQGCFVFGFYYADRFQPFLPSDIRGEKIFLLGFVRQDIINYANILALSYLRVCRPSSPPPHPSEVVKKIASVLDDFKHKKYLVTKKLWRKKCMKRCAMLWMEYLVHEFFFQFLLVFEIWSILQSTVNWGREIFANLIQKR